MITENIVGFDTRGGSTFVQGVEASIQTYLAEKFTIADQSTIDEALDKAVMAFEIYRHWSPDQRASFLNKISENILELGDTLISRACAESGLPEGRMMGERGRTIGQINMMATALRNGSWEENFIDQALPDRQPLPRPDIRKRLVPLGPVVVFAASNFPLAFSTGGGDVASALAVGCPVIVKAHDSHPGTNALVAQAIMEAARTVGAPDGVFSSLYGAGQDLGQVLVKDPRIKAVGFTGSYRAGRAIMDASAARPEPIPVYAEMGSINPVVVMASALEKRAAFIGEQLGGSMTLGVGQFCTKPGIILVQESPEFNAFYKGLHDKAAGMAASPMLNKRIQSSFVQSLQNLSGEVTMVNMNEGSSHLMKAAFAVVAGRDFLTHPKWHEEVFGPFAVIVKCDDPDQMIEIVRALRGQLTATIWSEPEDALNAKMIDALEQAAGRLVWNGVPTGVEVCDAQMHGGPFPATSHPFFGAVGMGSMKRWTRPVAYQNFPGSLLPNELKD
ncbi:MAG: aldehyde dehydrogenase (NADP(+)) [Saprospiraceae bacterium]|jgi:NADP-dependent aldehyde dehydrogenase|nr:aldehyde dehydrogenase (NADP(+)) [Saprospiraceae bacterium]MBK7435515.1 aldehyde dehydrogenase (NADP(+)) [Saprospiraceae bacterium]MBK8282063.1 aldehyde dehydrogenase (NADP(+)) [Saprospiraceae bacterium]MBK9681181.1 aldehyde dehydrogenase (NADP(+)) [Saprospiraceae bacterium]MBK9930011.1 aldehyde dehydrogenase (NADP(+)) [Saprospiraceae bacterium]